MRQPQDLKTIGLRPPRRASDSQPVRKSKVRHLSARTLQVGRRRTRYRPGHGVSRADPVRACRLAAAASFRIRPRRVRTQRRHPSRSSCVHAVRAVEEFYDAEIERQNKIAKSAASSSPSTRCICTPIASRPIARISRKAVKGRGTGKERAADSVLCLNRFRTSAPPANCLEAFLTSTCWSRSPRSETRLNSFPSFCRAAAPTLGHHRRHPRGDACQSCPRRFHRRLARTCRTGRNAVGDRASVHRLRPVGAASGCARRRSANHRAGASPR